MADFFDKMKDGFNKGVATVSTGSKTMIEKTKINSCIKNLEDGKRELLELLGKKVYNAFRETECDIPRREVEGFCNEIASRFEAIEEQKRKIAALEAEMEQVIGNGGAASSVCVCGHVNVAGARFCGKCGKTL